MKSTSLKIRPLPVKGNEWRLPLDDSLLHYEETLGGIPGLTYSYDAAEVRGPIDAVAAACYRLEVPCPPSIALKNESIESPGIKLFQFQKEGVRQLISILAVTGGALLADEMGLGKSRQAIALGQRTEGRKLVVAPAFAREVWTEELAKCGVRGAVIIRPGATKKHEEAWTLGHDAQWVVCSYEMLDQVIERCFAYDFISLLIFDEAHLMKGRKTRRAAAAEEAATMATYKLALTGTPMDNRPRDLYKLLRVLLGKRTVGSPSAFDFAYCAGQINEHGGMDNKGLSRPGELKKRLSYYTVRREKKEVLTQLPPLTRQVIWLDSDSEGVKAFKAAMLNRGKDSTYKALHATLECKMEAAVRLAVEAKRFLLFTYEREHARQLGKRIAEETPCVVITGEMNTQKRKAEADLAASKGWGIVATLGSMSTGVNLQAVGHIGIMHLLSWKPWEMAQAEARLARIGQEHPVTWYYLAARETMDEIVMRTILEKLQQAREALGVSPDLQRDLGSDDGNEEAALKALFDSL